MINYENIIEATRELTFELAIKHKYDIFRGEIELLSPDGYILKSAFVFMMDEHNKNIKPILSIGFIHANTFKFITDVFDGTRLKDFYTNAFSKFRRGRIELTFDDLYLAKHGTIEMFKKDTLKYLNLSC